MPDTIDRATLPPLFLPLAKSQARVDHDRDDAFITDLVAQAIDDVERLTNATIFARAFTIEGASVAPDALWGWATPCTGNWIGLPFNNITEFVATDANGDDFSAAYTVRQADPGGVGTAWMQGPLPGSPSYPAYPLGVTFAIQAGMATLEAIAPSLRRLILRRTAALYEYRESALPLSADDLASEPALWRPDL